MKAYFIFLKDNKILLLLFFALGVFSFFSSIHKKDDSSNSNIQNPDPKRDEATADTFIPKGMVLVPIELQNAEALNGILSPLGGVVDLYKSNHQKLENKNHKAFPLKVAKRVKLLRAPLNPQLFAVLVKDLESEQILSHEGPFVAVIQNPDSKESEAPQVFLNNTKVATKKEKNIEIVYEDLILP